MKYNKKIVSLIIIIIVLIIVLFFLFIEAAQAPRHNLQAVLGDSIDSFAKEMNFAPASEVSPVATSTTIIFGGDVMLSRVVGQKMVKYNDFTWPFKNVAGVMSQADFSVVNLESPFTISSKSHVVLTGSFSFNADPKTISGLKLAGIDLVSLANNHFGNQGKQGMLDTFKTLTQNNILYAGAGNNLKQAHVYKKVKINNLDFCFLAYAYPTDIYIAGSSTPGMADMDIALMQKDVAGAKKDCDKIIVLMHAGVEYTNKPNAQQKNFAHAAINSGAEMVVGHHPHWVQTTEVYNGKLIIYSLGNLVFDQMWSRETMQGALAKAYFENDVLKKIEIIPIEIRDYGQAVLASSTKAEILNRMGLKSGVINF